MKEYNVAYFEVKPQNFQEESEVYHKEFILDS